MVGQDEPLAAPSEQFTKKNRKKYVKYKNLVLDKHRKSQERKQIMHDTKMNFVPVMKPI